jgi:hypothetical protein
MVKTVADIAVNVTADIGPLVTGMAKAEASMSRFDRVAKAVSARLAGFGDRATALGAKMSAATAAIGAATAAAFALTKQAADLGDQIGNAARAAGMAPEYFQEMRYAIGEVADITDEDFASAMVRMNRVLGEAKEGSDSAVKALAALGITQDQVASGTLTSQQVLDAYVATMGNVTDPAIAAAISTDLFGKAGARMGGLMAGAAGQVGDLRDRARELGIVMSDEAVAASEQFNDKMGELSRQFDAVKIAIATVLMPVIVNDLIPVLQTRVIPAVVQVINKIGEWIEWFQALPGPVQEAVGAVAALFAVGGPLLIAIGATATAISALVAASGPIGLFIAAAGVLTAAWVAFGDDIQAAVGGAIEFISAKIDAFLATLDTIIDKLRQWRDMAKEATGYQPAGAGGFAPDDAANLPQVQGMGTAILNGGSAGADTLGTTIGDTVAQAARDALGIKSPSTVFAEIGVNIGEGLAQGIASTQGLVASSVTTLGDTAVTATGGMATQVLGILGNMFEGSKAIAGAQALVNAWAGASEALKMPYPQNLLAFGKVLATGMSAVRNIKGAKIGGGSGAASAAGGGGASVTAPSYTANVTLVGESFSGDQVANLFRQLNEGLGRGFQINLAQS